MTPILTVELHLTGGQIDRFALDDADHARMLVEQLNPLKVFSGAPIAILEPHCLTTYRTQQVVRIDVNGTGTPKWGYLGNASNIVEVSADDFDRLSGSEELVRKRLEAWQKPGTAQQGFTMIDLTDGSRIIWQVDMVSTEMVALDTLSIVRHLMNAGALHGHRADGAAMIINMAHVSRLSFYPGPPVTSRVPAAKRI